jgi:hypothetical protein
LHLFPFSLGLVGMRGWLLRVARRKGRQNTDAGDFDAVIVENRWGLCVGDPACDFGCPLLMFRNSLTGFFRLQYVESEALI